MVRAVVCSTAHRSTPQKPGPWLRIAFAGKRQVHAFIMLRWSGHCRAELALAELLASSHTLSVVVQVPGFQTGLCRQLLSLASHFVGGGACRHARKHAMSLHRCDAHALCVAPPWARITECTHASV